MLANPKDPLKKSGPEAQAELFHRFAKSANGFSTEDAINASANVIINALRQAYGDRQSVEPRFDELFGRMKSLLLDHYDQLGRKRGVFPYNQVISVSDVLRLGGLRKAN